MKDIKEKSFRCDCIGGQHYIHFCGFEGSPDDPKELWVDILARENSPLKWRIKQAWNLLVGKKLRCGEITLEKEKSLELAKFLNDFWDTP